MTTRTETNETVSAAAKRAFETSREAGNDAGVALGCLSFPPRLECATGPQVVHFVHADHLAGRLECSLGDVNRDTVSVLIHDVDGGEALHNAGLRVDLGERDEELHPVASYGGDS